jgi:hypothetical protein
MIATSRPPGAAASAAAMARGGERVVLAGGVARKRRVHQDDAGANAELPDRGGIMGCDRSGREQLAQDLRTDRIKLVEVERPPLPGPLREHAGPALGSRTVSSGPIIAIRAASHASASGVEKCW